MKTQDFSVLLASSLEELLVQLKNARREVVRMRMGVRTGQEKNTAAYSAAKKLVAQLHTAIAQKEFSA